MYRLKYNKVIFLVNISLHGFVCIRCGRVGFVKIACFQRHKCGNCVFTR